MSGPGAGNCGQLLTDGSHCVLPAGHYQSEPDDDHENGYGVSLMAAGRGDSMTRSKRHRNQATLAVDLNELDAIITALVSNSGAAPQPDPGLLSYLDTKRENLRKRIGMTAPELPGQNRYLPYTSSEQDQRVLRKHTQGDEETS